MNKEEKVAQLQDLAYDLAKTEKVSFMLAIDLGDKVATQVGGSAEDLVQHMLPALATAVANAHKQPHCTLENALLDIASRIIKSDDVVTRTFSFMEDIE